MRAYHRVDPLMDEKKSHYSPAQFGAFMKLQLVAGRQAQPGRFRSMAAVKAALPSDYGKHLPFLVTEGDVVPLPSGEAYVDGFDEWQMGDLTVGERMRRLRERKRHQRVTPPVTPAVTKPSPAAIGVGVGTGVGSSPPPGANGAPDFDESDDDPWDAPEAGAIVWLSQHGCYIPPVSGYYRQVVLGVENNSVEAMVGAFNRLLKAGVKKGDTKGFVFGALDALRVKPDLRGLDKAEREETAATAFDRAVARTQREQARLRGETA